MKTIYFDNNATTAVAPEVREAILPYLGEFYGNPSSMHTFGGQVADAVETARENMRCYTRARRPPGYVGWAHSDATLTRPGIPSKNCSVKCKACTTPHRDRSGPDLHCLRPTLRPHARAKKSPADAGNTGL